MRKQIGRVLLALCLVATTMALPVNENEWALQQVTYGASQFSNNFFKVVSNKKPGNLISSPLSASMVLTMAAGGAAGNTLAQFKEVLHLPNDEATTRTGSQILIDTLNNVKDVNLRIANKIYTNKGFTVKPSFRDLTATYYRSAAQTVDFSNSAAAVGTINAWCEEQTSNRIKDLLSPSDVNAMTAMVLVNAVYFKGQWKNKFNPQFTTDRPFHINENTVKPVPTMYIKNDLKYGQLPEMQASYVEIPYKGDDMSMVIILPNEVNGLSRVVEKMQNTNLADVLKDGYKREVKLYLPKFKIESTIELDEVLQQLGLTDMYSTDANFSGISDVPLYVSKAIQKAFIEVNEEGSEAAAATGGGISSRRGRRMNEIQVNRPFYFTIVKRVLNWRPVPLRPQMYVKLFVGQVVKP